MNEIPIYCINLLRATERKQSIINDWVIQHGFSINFFEAFDKKELEEKNNYIYEYRPKIPILKIKRPMGFGEIACVTSFCLLAEKILSSDLQEVIIMEDDIIPLFSSKEYFFHVIEQSKVEYPEAEVALFHKPLDVWLWHKGSDDYKFYEKKKYFSLLKNSPWGTQLIYFKRDGLQKFYDALVKMQYPADFPWNDIFTPEKKIIYCNDPLVYHDNTENSTTYIGNEYRGITRKYINE